MQVDVKDIILKRNWLFNSGWITFYLGLVSIELLVNREGRGPRRPWSQSIRTAPFVLQSRSSRGSASHIVNLCAPMLAPTGVVLVFVVDCTLKKSLFLRLCVSYCWVISYFHFNTICLCPDLVTSVHKPIKFSLHCVWCYTWLYNQYLLLCLS